MPALRMVQRTMTRLMETITHECAKQHGKIGHLNKLLKFNHIDIEKVIIISEMAFLEF